MTARKLRARFYGRVQGVGFRYTVQTICSKHGLTGWVRNVDDGSVEADLYGEVSEIEAALASIKAARSTNLREVRQELPDVVGAAPKSFEIQH